MLSSRAVGGLGVMLLLSAASLAAASAGATVVTPTRMRQSVDRELRTIKESAAYRDFLSYKREGRARDSALYREMAAALKKSVPGYRMDISFLRDSKTRKQVIQQFAYCHLVAEEKLMTLLPEVLGMLPYKVSLLGAATMSRHAERLSVKDIYEVWPAAHAFLVLPPKEVLPRLEENVFKLPTYEARRAAFELSEVVRLRAVGEEVTGSPALHRLLTALSRVFPGAGTDLDPGDGN